MELSITKIKHIPVMLAIALAGCQSKTEEAGKAAASASTPEEITLSTEQIRNAGIVLDLPVKRSISMEIQVSGVLDVPPQNLHSIGARVAGMVKSTALLQGAHVHKGDVLCLLENAEYLNWQQEYISEKARLEMLEADMQRQQDLAGKNLSSQKNLQQIQAEWKIARAARTANRQKLQLNGFSLSEIDKGNFNSELAVRAPEDGFITSVYINTGQVLKEGDPICELVNPEHIHAELMVFEKDVASIREGQDVDFELVSDPGTKHRAKVFLVNRKIGKERTVQVHAHLEDHNPEFLPNMQITAAIHTTAQSAWTLPEEAIVYDGNEAAIFIGTPKPGTFRKIPIKVLLKEGGRVAVNFPSGYSPEATKAVVKGAYDIKSASEKDASAEE